MARNPAAERLSGLTTLQKKTQVAIASAYRRGVMAGTGVEAGGPPVGETATQRAQMRRKRRGAPKTAIPGEPRLFIDEKSRRVVNEGGVPVPTETVKGIRARALARLQENRRNEGSSPYPHGQNIALPSVMHGRAVGPAPTGAKTIHEELRLRGAPLDAAQIEAKKREGLFGVMGSNDRRMEAAQLERDTAYLEAQFPLPPTQEDVQNQRQVQRQQAIDNLPVSPAEQRLIFDREKFEYKKSQDQIRREIDAEKQVYNRWFDSEKLKMERLSDQNLRDYRVRMANIATARLTDDQKQEALAEADKNYERGQEEIRQQAEDQSRDSINELIRTIWTSNSWRGDPPVFDTPDKALQYLKWIEGKLSPDQRVAIAKRKAIQDAHQRDLTAAKMSGDIEMSGGVVPDMRNPYKEPTVPVN